jgi:hypothetical protein
MINSAIVAAMLMHVLRLSDRVAWCSKGQTLEICPKMAMKRGPETKPKRRDIAKWKPGLWKIVIHCSAATEMLSTAGSDGRLGWSFRRSRHHVNCIVTANGIIALFYCVFADDLLYMVYSQWYQWY